MAQAGGARPIGKLAIFLAIVVALGGLTALAWPRLTARYGVTMLDLADRIFAPSGGVRRVASAQRYGGDPAQTLEIYTPDSQTAAPRAVLVFVHGGGWNSGRPADYGFIGRRFARAGYVVVLAGYRLVPDGVWPAMLEDTASALAWTHSHIARFGGDPARVQVMGQSAGAYNVVSVALDRQWLERQGVPDGFIKGVIGLSGPYDFYPFTNPSAQAAFGHVPDPQVTQPIYHVRAGAPPMLLLTGDRDVTVKPRNSVALAKALSAQGDAVELAIVPGLEHVDTVVKLAAPFSRDDRIINPVLRFLAAHRGASAPVQPPAP